MRFQSSLSNTSKESRAVVLTLALTELLSRAGERVGLFGGRPFAGRNTSRKVAEVLLNETAEGSLPPDARLSRFGDVIILEGFEIGGRYLQIFDARSGERRYSSL